MKNFQQDVRYALRMLRKNPGFTAIAVLTLALGIGANTAIFSVVSGVLLRPLPYPNPNQLVSVTGSYPRGAFVAMHQQIRSMDVAVYAEGYAFNLTGLGDPVRLTATSVSAELFSILGARPELGRTLRVGEDIAGQDSFVILSHALWQQKFAGDPNIIGRWITLEGAGYQVIGVMPPDFRFPSPETQLWVPLNIDSRQPEKYWAGDYMPMIGRLRPGATIAQAAAEARSLQPQLRALFPWPMPPTWNPDVTVVSLQSGMVSDERARMLILLGAVALVLLIACANVANLMLSRAATREREFAIRSVLGAGRQRMIRQLLTESSLIAVIGGALGLFLAVNGLSLLKSALPADLPRLADIGIDWRVLCFTAALAVLTGIVFGLAPALHFSRNNFAESLKSGARGSTVAGIRRLRSALVTSEVALAVLLVIAAGLLIRSLWTLSHVNPGFRPESILTARINPTESFCAEPQRCESFYRELLDRVRALPGANGAALISTLPLGGRVTKLSAEVEDHPPSSSAPLPLFWENMVSPGYFHLMDIHLLSGRTFTDADASATPPVTIVTASTARRFWPGQSPIGKHIKPSRENNWYTVVGVVADVRGYSLERNIPDQMDGAVYVPFGSYAEGEAGKPPVQMTLTMRTSADLAQTANLLRSTVASLNPEVPVTEVKPMRSFLSDAVSTPRSTTALFVAFVALALALGVTGIYGVLSYFVAQRTREIGIRVALGAQRSNVLQLVLLEGAKMSGLGIAIGLAAAFALTRLMQSLLYGVGTSDPLTFLGVIVVIAVVTLLACYVPARRAMRVDPIVALRYE
ncbi:MAG: ABC transporter permease [Candidatus Acidiferrales bacterium]